MRITDHRITNRTDKILGLAGIFMVVIFLLGWALGIRGPILIDNYKCYALLGCNMGFFGYDAVLHFWSGIMDVVLIIWLTRNFPALNIFRKQQWKNFLITISLVAFISVAWEIGELGHDQYRMKVLHQDLLNENLITPNHLDQPTNNDTMGDMTFAIIGSALTVLSLNSLIPKNDICD